MRINATEVVFNDRANNVDFRVESLTNANGIFIDASAETMLLMGGSGSTGCSIDASGNLTCAGTISGSGSLGGSGTATQIAFFSAGTTLTSNVGLTYDATNGLIGNADNTAARDFCWDGDTVECALEVDAGTDKVNVNQLVSTGGVSSTTGSFTANAGNVKTGWQFVGADTLLTCAAGVATFDPAAGSFTQYVRVDANGAACAITIGETNATLATNVTFYIATSAGAGAVTFPDVANTHDGPTLCTTTGLTINGTYAMTFANLANDAYLGTSCTQN